jgi:hypothetical protein
VYCFDVVGCHYGIVMTPKRRELSRYDLCELASLIRSLRGRRKGLDGRQIFGGGFLLRTPAIELRIYA